MGITEVELTHWKVKVGDRVENGSAVAEIEMEKASTILEAHESGVIKEIFYDEGDIVLVGSIICNMEEE